METVAMQGFQMPRRALAHLSSRQNGYLGVSASLHHHTPG